MPLIAAGVAFYAFLSLVPTLIAATLVYGLVTTPAQVQSQISSLSSVLPGDAASLVGKQMASLAESKSTGLGIGLVISLVLALWSASGGVGNLIAAVNTAYDEKETRNFFKKRGLALFLTIGAIIVFVVTTSLVAVFPAVANALNVSGFARPGSRACAGSSSCWCSWRRSPCCTASPPTATTPSSVGVHRRRRGGGGLGPGVRRLLALRQPLRQLQQDVRSPGGDRDPAMWLWLSLVAVLLGAEINAEMEKQTVKDTTTGPRSPSAGVTPSRPTCAPPTPIRTRSSSTRSDEAVG